MLAFLNKSDSIPLPPPKTNNMIKIEAALNAAARVLKVSFD